MFMRPFLWPIAGAAHCGRPSGCRLSKNRARKRRFRPGRGAHGGGGSKNQARLATCGGAGLPAGPTGGTRMRAFIFPGQGSQAVGMGKVLADASRAARAVFEEVDDALSQKLSRLMAEGPQEELTLTENAQPAIM